HEALLRQWGLFAKDWLVQERSDADELRSLVKQANDHRRGKGGLLPKQDLIRIRDWKERSYLQWAHRYVPAGMWNEAIAFVQESKNEADRAQQQRKRRRIFFSTVFAFGVIILIAIAAFGYQMNQSRKLLKQQVRQLVDGARKYTETAKAF